MRTITWVVAALFVTGCANFQSVESMNGSAPQSTTAGVKTTTNGTLNKLQKVYADYRGTPYRYGGSDRTGFDCSGFINTAYDDAFGMSLPRTTEGLASQGKPIRRDQLKPGDIIIFQTSVKQLHAGIYTGSGKFIHASTSKGVIESSLVNEYWKQRYIKARRYL